ncbi:MAG TPA: hypothetical protein VET86_14605 [Casimicrobiaceae bacterium]|nr:hypothetical protein [Casimicrobiaceae bacterium]
MPLEGFTSSKAATGSRPADDFSLVLGGPLFQLLRRAHLSGGALELARRRIVAISLFLWLPLLVLAAVDGTALGGDVKVPFLHDVDAHVRFLVALPLLIAAELVVHQRMRVVVGQFTTLGLVPDALRGRFDAAIERALRLRNSVVAELLLIGFVYVVGIFVVWQHYFALEAPTWYALPEGGHPRPRLAGWWYFYVSLPLFQFIFLRWYFRLFVWARFLWDVSRLPLALAPLHPDRTGGLGFLTRIVHAFAPLLLAQGALLSGTLANRIFFDGASLADFKLEIAGMVILAVLVVVLPLSVFIPSLMRAKREGLREYGKLAKRYVTEFDRKWLHGTEPPAEPLVGSADVQSLADLGNAFEVVRGMRIVPVTKETVAELAIMTLLPVTPLLLTMVSVEQLLDQVLKVVF